MTKRGYVFTSECVNMGHPDKVADQISDAILDAIFAQDPMSRVACETLVTKGLVFVAGEITTNCWVDFNAVIRDTVRDIGYVYEDEGFFYKSLAVINTIHDQSPDIAQGVVRRDDFGAGDQGMMFGYAVRNAYDDSLLPLPMILSRRICNRLAEVRHNGTLPWLRPDGKCQVSVRYEDGQPVGIATILISTQHAEEVADKMNLVREALAEEVVKKVFPAVLLDGVNLADENVFLVNPTGRFVEGGPAADTGLTGRKIIVDTYGSMGRHGGGAFSGKDPTKVDRSGAYMARYIAKNIVAAGLADRCEVQFAYAIGRPLPVSTYVETFGTAKVPEQKIEDAVKNSGIFNPSVAGIIDTFKLRRPIYLQTAKYGHFGHAHYPWEQTDKASALRQYLNFK